MVVPLPLPSPLRESSTPVPTAGITNNYGTTVLTCSTTSISLTATGGGTYSWSNGLGTSAAASVSAPKYLYGYCYWR